MVRKRCGLGDTALTTAGLWWEGKGRKCGRTAHSSMRMRPCTQILIPLARYVLACSAFSSQHSTLYQSVISSPFILRCTARLRFTTSLPEGSTAIRGSWPKLPAKKQACARLRGWWLQTDDE